MKIKNFFYQNNQRKKLYKVWYEKKFSEYPYYSFMRRNKNVHASLAPHCMKLVVLERQNKYMVLILYSAAEGGYAFRCYLFWKMDTNLTTYFLLKAEMERSHPIKELLEKPNPQSKNFGKCNKIGLEQTLF